MTHHVPVVDRVIATEEPRRVDDPVDIADLYDEMVELRRDNIVRAVELIADHIGTGPVLVHCMAGKDRTGIVVALVQAALSACRWRPSWRSTPARTSRPGSAARR